MMVGTRKTGRRPSVLARLGPSAQAQIRNALGEASLSPRPPKAVGPVDPGKQRATARTVKAVGRTAPWYAVIAGELASKANDRRLVSIRGKTRSIKSAKALNYVSALIPQVARLAPLFEDDLRLDVMVWYATRRPDLDISLGGLDFQGDTGTARMLGDVPFNVFARAISARARAVRTRARAAAIALSSCDDSSSAIGWPACTSSPSSTSSLEMRPSIFAPTFDFLSATT